MVILRDLIMRRSALVVDSGLNSRLGGVSIGVALAPVGRQYRPTSCGRRLIVVLIMSLIYSCVYTADTPGIPGGTGYICLSKAMPWSEIDNSEEALAGGVLFEIAALVQALVVACTPCGVAVPICDSGWVNMVTTPSRPSSVSRRLSREFRLV